MGNRLWLGLLLGVWPAHEVSAQEVRGHVRADSTGSPIAGAEVWIEGQLSRVRSDQAGRYRLTSIPAGSHRLLARAVGFRPVAFPALVAPGDTLDVDLVLLPLAVELAPLEVTALGPKPLSARMREFEERRREGFGRFLTREELARYDHGPVTTALRAIAGLRLAPLPCKGGYAVSTMRGGSEQSMKPLFCSGVSGRKLTVPPGCYLSIYVDGVLLWSWANTLRDGSLDQEPPNMDEIKALDLQAVEVYRGPSELPSRYQGTNSACGAVLFWTRER